MSDPSRITKFAENPETGERLGFDGRAWVPVPKAVNPDTNETLEYFEHKWVSPLKKPDMPSPDEADLEPLPPSVSPGSPMVGGAVYPGVTPPLRYSKVSPTQAGPGYRPQQLPVDSEKVKASYEKEQARISNLMDIEKKMFSGEWSDIKNPVDRFIESGTRNPIELSKQTFRYVVGPDNRVYRRGREIGRDALSSLDPELSGVIFSGRGVALQGDVDTAFRTPVGEQVLPESFLPKGAFDIGRRVLDKKTGKLVKPPVSIDDILYKLGSSTREGLSGTIADTGVFLAEAVGAKKASKLFSKLRMKTDVSPIYNDLSDSFASGAGSMAAFMGIGSMAGGLARAGKAGKWIASGVMGAAEAATEAGGTYQSAVDKGWTEDKAHRAMWKVFFQNLPLNVILDKVGVLNDDAGTFLKKLARSGRAEATQEAAQQIIQNIALERPWSEGVPEAALVGGVIGGGTTAIAETMGRARSDVGVGIDADSAATLPDLLTEAELPKAIRRGKLVKSTKTQQGGLDALQIGSPETQVPPTGEGGQAIPEGGGGIRPGEQGQEVAGASEAQTPVEEKVEPVRFKLGGKEAVLENRDLIDEHAKILEQHEANKKQIAETPMTREQRARAFKAEGELFAKERGTLVDKQEMLRGAQETQAQTEEKPEVTKIAEDLSRAYNPNGSRPVQPAPLPSEAIYHGSVVADLKPGELSLAHANPDSYFGHGIYTGSREVAEAHGSRGEEGSLHEVKHNMKAPIDLGTDKEYSTQELKSLGVESDESMSGFRLWRELINQHGGKDKAREFLMSQGYDGVRFTSGSSKDSAYVAWTQEAAGKNVPISSFRKGAILKPGAENAKATEPERGAGTGTEGGLRVAEGEPVNLATGDELGTGAKTAERQIADSLGGQQIYEKILDKLGLGPDATLPEIGRAVMAKIKTLGQTVQETTVRILGQIRGLGRDAANIIAQHLHDAFGGTRRGQLGAIGKVPKYITERAKAAKGIVTDKTSPIAGKSIPTIADIDPIVDGHIKELENVKKEDLPPGIPASVISNLGKEMRREYFSVHFRGKDITPARWLMSPAIIAMRSPELQRVNLEINRFVGNRENTLQTFNDSLQALKSITKEQRNGVSKALTGGTIENDGRGVVWTDRQLSSWFKLDRSGIGAYREVVKQMKNVKDLLVKSETGVHDRNRNKLIELLNKQKDESARARIKEQIKELDDAFSDYLKNFSNEAYFPLMRFGNFMITVKDGSGERIGMAFLEKTDNKSVEESLSEMAAQSDEVRDAFAENSFSVEGPHELPKLDDLKNNGGAIFDAAFMRYLTAAKEIDPKLMTEIELAAANSYLQDTWKNHIQHRTGLPGYSMDGMRTLQTFARTVSNRIANNNHGHRIESALSNMGRESMGDRYDSTLESEARNIVDSAKNPPFHPVANTLTTLAFLGNLGGKIDFVLTNLTQQGTMGLPVLGTLYGYGKAMKALATGNRIAANLVSRGGLVTGLEEMNESKLLDMLGKHTNVKNFSQYNNPTALSLLVRDVLHSAVRDGELRPKVSNELMHHESDKQTGKVVSALNTVAEYAGIFASKSEQQNRIATLVACTILSNQNGSIIMDEEGWRLGPRSRWFGGDRTGARESAETMNRIINFSSGRGNLSPYQRVGGLGGGILRTATQFRRFSIDAATALHNLGILNYRKAKEENKGAARRLLAYAKPNIVNYAVVTMLGGASAIPAWLLLRIMLKAVLGDDYAGVLVSARAKAEEIVSEALGKIGFSGDVESTSKRLVFAAENGLPNLTGVNLNAALSTNLVMGPDNASMAENLGRLVAGPSVGKMVEIGESVSDGDLRDMFTWREALRTASPRALNNIAQAVSGEARFGAEGIELTPTERAMKAMSIQPTRVSRLQQAKGESIDLQSAKRDLTKYLTKMYRSAGDDNRDDVFEDKIRPRIDKFNDLYGDIDAKLRIKPDDIKKPVKKEFKKNPRLYERAGVEESK